MFVEIIQNVVDPTGARHAALSHNPREHFKKLFHRDASALDETCNHAQIPQHGRVDRHSMGCLRRDWSVIVEGDLIRWVHTGRISRVVKWTTRGLLGRLVVSKWARFRLASFGVETLLLGLPGFRLVVPLRSLGGELSAVMLPAAERTAQIPTSTISGVGQKEYPAMFASCQAPSKMRLGLQDRPQQEVILQYKMPNRLIVIPSFAIFKTLPDFYYKFDRFSLMMLICFFMSSSYPIEATASTGGAGIFCLSAISLSCNWQDQTELRIVRAQ